MPKIHGLMTGLASQENRRLNSIWKNMIKRCCYSGAKGYEHYGGRGITICPEWRQSFQAFYNWAKKSGYSDRLTLDRIDNDGNYYPANCRFISFKEQQRNKRSNIRVIIGNESLTLIELAEKYFLPPSTVYWRHKNGWPPELLVREAGGRR